MWGPFFKSTWQNRQLLFLCSTFVHLMCHYQLLNLAGNKYSGVFFPLLWRVSTWGSMASTSIISKAVGAMVIHAASELFVPHMVIKAAFPAISL